MKFKLFTFYVLNFFLVLNFITFANSIELNITGSIFENSNLYQENINLNLNCNESINFSIPNNSYNIFINNVSTKNISFYFNNCNNINKINYSLDIFEDLSNNEFRLERNLNNFDNINYKYQLNIPLEYEFEINKSAPNKYLTKYLKNKKILEFNKSNIFVLYFNKNSDSEQENNVFKIVNLIKEIYEKEVIFLILISIILTASITYYFMNQKIKKILQIQVPSYVLSKEDRLVLEIIKENSGINQKQIALKLNYSKSRVSAIISVLDEKQLIKREKFGRSYKVYLNKKIV